MGSFFRGVPGQLGVVQRRRAATTSTHFHGRGWRGETGQVLRTPASRAACPIRRRKLSPCAASPQHKPANPSRLSDKNQLNQHKCPPRTPREGLCCAVAVQKLPRAPAPQVIHERRNSAEEKVPPPTLPLLVVGHTEGLQRHAQWRSGVRGILCVEIGCRDGLREIVLSSAR